MEMELRKYLWINHGCEVGNLYGDDGEMQCSKCQIDFKRSDEQSLIRRLKSRNSQKSKESVDNIQQIKDSISLLSGMLEACKLRPFLSSVQIAKGLYAVIAKLEALI